MKNLAYTVAKRELVGLFASPLSGVFIVIFLVTAGFFTFNLGMFFERNEASLFAFFIWHPWLYLFLVPAVGMRLWSEDKRQGTIELLLTFPISPWQAILGKFLASWAFLAIALALTFPMIITVNYLGDADMGPIVCGYLGSFLLAGAYLAITSMTSAMTRSQVVSFIISVVICLFLILAGYPPVTDMFSGWTTALIEIVAGFSVMPHFERFQQGVLDIRDVVYFLSIIAFSLFATSFIIRSERSR